MRKLISIGQGQDRNLPAGTLEGLYVAGKKILFLIHTPSLFIECVELPNLNLMIDEEIFHVYMDNDIFVHTNKRTLLYVYPPYAAGHHSVQFDINRFQRRDLPELHTHLKIKASKDIKSITFTFETTIKKNRLSVVLDNAIHFLDYTLESFEHVLETKPISDFNIHACAYYYSYAVAKRRVFYIAYDQKQKKHTLFISGADGFKPGDDAHKVPRIETDTLKIAAADFYNIAYTDKNIYIIGDSILSPQYLSDQKGWYNLDIKLLQGEKIIAVSCAKGNIVVLTGGSNSRVWINQHNGEPLDVKQTRFSPLVTTRLPGDAEVTSVLAADNTTFLDTSDGVYTLVKGVPRRIAGIPAETKYKKVKCNDLADLGLGATLIDHDGFVDLAATLNPTNHGLNKNRIDDRDL
jgi:hypothetical protein